MASLTADPRPVSLIQSHRRRRRSLVPTSSLTQLETTRKTGLQPGQLCLQLSLLRSAVNVPRVIRNRVQQHEKLSTRKKSKTPEGMKSPTSPHQECITNSATGRVAVGPWTGPFAPHPSTVDAQTLPATLYLDPWGGCHFELDYSASQKLTAAVQAQSVVPIKQVAETKFGQQLFPRSTSKPWACGKGARGVRRTHMINQPRRG